ncbi:pyruvate kinase [Chlamydia pecorum]|uniref:Pyruvate kinase n=2 Tax=Chlamydia pecorum TaxID=85991 RepID=A0AA34WIG9_CHLPE|nr:pyruvate kinase [Chlamydia pecorum]AEB41967.1 pyruvate kinase [Chlamydia pecorum E58]UFP06581.1 pyruvate kinase [Chlamydia pecorum]UJT77303.1 pyruvate kinase [Chlamydia pecorum]
MVTRTKIICTIGPATSSPEMLEKLIDAGMNVARLNFSHGTHESHGETIRTLKELRKKKEVPLAIMLDTKGPEIRLGRIPTPIRVSRGQRIRLIDKDIEGSLEQGITLVPNTIFPFIREGAQVLIDDGYVHAKVVSSQANSLELEILSDGELKSHKSLSIRDIEVSLPFMTDKDLMDLKFGVEQGVDFIAASFVRCREDIESMRKSLEDFGGPKIPIIAKIENRLGVKNFSEIVECADGIMIARGDLGIELSVVEVPHLQKMMARISREAGRFCVTATQMLESMIRNVLPTRAEVSDIANAIYDGTSAVMLSGETASGEHPISAACMMRSVIQETEKNLEYASFLDLDESRSVVKVSPCLSSIGVSGIQIAEKAGAKAIIVYTESGSTPIFLSKYRPKFPIIAVTPELSLYYRLAVEWGVYPMLTRKETDRMVWRREACIYGIEQGILSNYDKVLVFSRGAFMKETNNLTLTVVNDILTSSAAN